MSEATDEGEPSLKETLAVSTGDMMTACRLVLMSAALGLILSKPAPAAAISPAIPTGPGTVEFVDGVKTNCEVLFRHPHSDGLIVRSSRRSTAQSFDLTTVRRITAGSKNITLHARRGLA